MTHDLSRKKSRWLSCLLFAVWLVIGKQVGMNPTCFAKDDRPNVLFLAVDDMNDWIGCLGGYGGVVHTPNIDRLAESGMLFNNAHCVSPKCAPSRAALLTGLRPSTTGLYDNGHWWLPNLEKAHSLPLHFRNNGYQVVGAGKIFHHTAGNHPPNQWDRFQRIEFREDPWFRGNRLNYPWSRHSTFPGKFPFSGVNGLGHENDWGSLDIPDSDYDDELTVRFTIDFLERMAISRKKGKHEKPFFLACGLFRPHLPWYVPQRFFNQYPLEKILLPQVQGDDLEDLPTTGLQLAADRRSDFDRIRNQGSWKNAIQAYLASISCADDRLGRVLKALRQSGLERETLVVLWSDHGWHLGEKQHWHKSTLWEESTRVPLVIRLPDAKPGTCRRPVSLLDLFPTLVSLCRLQNPPQKLDGHSLKNLVLDPNSSWAFPALTEFRKGNAAVRDQRFRYIRYQNGGEELYDHLKDPHEFDNLADDPAYRKKRKELSRWIPEKWAPPAAGKKAFHFDPGEFTWVHRKSGRVVRGK
ncbi:MAG: sulfatase [Planctomycetota bacterium]|nr:sulfatase [Planctomycetota bacterium]